MYNKHGGAFMYQIYETKMLRAVRNSLPQSAETQRLLIESMVFLLVALICTVPQSIATALYSSVAMLFDPRYYELMMAETLDISALFEYMTDLMTNLPDWMYAVTLASSGFMILGAIVYCKAFQKRSPFTLGFNRRGVLAEYLMGAVIGFVMISIPALVCHVTGCVTFTPNENASPLMILIFFLAFILQGMGEEALFRGYFMTSLARRYNVWLAIIASSLMFSAFHMNNPNFSIIAFINITLFGIFAGVFMLKRGSIWAVGAIHSLWNFAQSNLFGFNVSGNPKFESLLSSANSNFGDILSGGDFGLEGGLGATIVLLVAILLALLMPTKKSELCPPVESPRTPKESE